MAPSLPQLVRKLVYDTFVERGRAPHLEEIIQEFRLDRQEAIDTLEALEGGRLLHRLPGTQRILMAWPFANMATPFLVRTESRRSYYANCAWDAIGLHVLLRQPVRIQAYCRHCGEPLELSLQDEKVVERRPEGVLVHFSKPAAQWFEDIIDTCGNTMNFFSSREHLEAWREGDQGKRGSTLSLEQVVAMSRFLYGDRLKVDYVRPSAKDMVAFFTSIGLTGSFWEV